MTKTRRWTIAGVAIVVVVFVIYGARKKTPVAPPSPPHAFDICIGHSEKRQRQVWNDAVLSGVARQLNDGERAGLEEALGVAATRWEARANPLLEDLEDGDPDASIAKWFKTAPTFVRTAQASAKLRLCTPDGFCVIPRAKGAACPPEHAPAADAKEDDRARFILWPWGHALRFRAKTPDEARSAAGLLRTKARDSNVIAIVMTKEDAEVTKAPPFAELRERWGKVGALSRIARKEPAHPPPSTFTVDAAPEDIIVLPRLDALSGGANADELIERDVLTAAPMLSAARSEPTP